MGRLIRPLGLLTGLAGVVATAHAGPVVSGIPALRRCWPVLAGRGRPDHVALTFDDGPDSRGTPQVLDVLAAHRVHATFFVLGSMVARHPDVLRRVVAEGHEVAVHSWDHRNHLLRLSSYQQLARTVDVIERTVGMRPTYCRPPYGAMSGGHLLAARRLGLQPLLWTAWGRDWEERATGASIRDLALSQLRSGGTVLLHDSDCTSSANSWQATVDALPGILTACAERGLTPGPVREHGL